MSRLLSWEGWSGASIFVWVVLCIAFGVLVARTVDEIVIWIRSR